MSLRPSRRLPLAGLLAAGLVVVGVPAAAAEPVAAAVPAAAPVTTPTAAAPTITVPPAGTHGFPFGAEAQNLGAIGYTEQEFFIGGTATSYDPVGSRTPDGKWGATPGATAPYQTRILVRRPTDQAHFNGTVVVEWLNDTAQTDLEADWAAGRSELERGYAWVGVSAQTTSVNGSALAAVGVPGLKQWDPARYGTLRQDGDQYSFDIFSQAGQAIRTPHGPNPLGNLRADRILAIGDSQSALRLTTYVNSIAPLTHEFDGYLIHSNVGSDSPLDATTIDLSGVPPVLRTDLGVPTLLVETESDVAIDHAARQPDSATVHTWEVVGTAHADKWEVDTAQGVLDKSLGLSPIDTATVCGDGAPPPNDGPGHYAIDAGLADLASWSRGGPAPATVPFMQLGAGSTIARDPATGLALGGLRLPDVQVPTRTLSGVRGFTLSSLQCVLFGASDPWDGDTDSWDHTAIDPSDPTQAGGPEPKPAVLYPTHAVYVAKVSAAAAADVQARVLTAADASTIVAAARASTVGG